jgi:hypothetical protein
MQCNPRVYWAVACPCSAALRKPFQPLPTVLGCAFAQEVARRELVLSISAFLFGSFPEPFHGFLSIPRYALAF